MNNDNTIIIIICGTTMLAGLGWGIAHRVKTGKGIGFRFLQFLVISMGIPAFIILALTDKIDSKMIGGVMMGVLAGFGISKAGKEEE